ncbi:MAG: glyceraldehyde 3-phosphate dehydrogenase NAD-binding domain-containing protein [bacterium]|nr:glyceraldehyde 3-phosphate dehydrogenase NAD-binding domain-containing protein [bacterium]
MAKVKVAINGLGRIGRAFLKQAVKESALQVVAVNDLGDLENLAYLLRYDSAYGPYNEEIKTAGDSLLIAGQTIKFLQQKDPTALPWRELNIDVVVESTGVFETYDKSKAHLLAGARKVVISAPAKDEPPAGLGGATVLVGINEDKLATCQISSNGSCTTNAASPLIAILDEAIGIERAILNTVHGYTASQKLVDSPDTKDFRRGRAAAANIIPATTGAAIAVTKVLPNLIGKFDGLAVRVPVVSGSLVDVTFVAKRPTSVEEVNNILTSAARAPRWQGIFAVTNEPLVSTDILNSPYGSFAQLDLTKVVDKTLVKVLAWYDNETGYARTLIRHVIKTGQS